MKGCGEGAPVLTGTPGSLHAGKGRPHEGPLTRDLVNQDSCSVPPRKTGEGLRSDLPFGGQGTGLQETEGPVQAPGGRARAPLASPALCTESLSVPGRRRAPAHDSRGPASGSRFPPEQRASASHHGQLPPAVTDKGTGQRAVGPIYRGEKR